MFSLSTSASSLTKRIQFDVNINGPSKTKEPIRDLVKSDLVPQLRQELKKLAPALIKEHGQGIQHAPGSGPPTGYTTPTNKTTSSSGAQSINKSATSAASSTATGAHVNTVPVSSTSEFRTSAAELYTTFTDPQRIAAFTRSPPTTFEGAKPGGKFVIFGNGVHGEYVSLKEPSQIVQKWRLSTWPQGHYSNLTLDFDQDDANGVTNMRANWDKVPVGEEDTTKGKWEEYYVRGLKTTFGYVETVSYTRILC
jgi:activator of HSP90 ATPase